MATVHFQILSKKNPSNLYCRLLNGRKTDVRRSINVFVNPKYWDFKREIIKNITSVKNRDFINKKLAQLKIEIIDAYNSASITGEIVDGEWMKSVIDNFFNRPKLDKTQKKSNHTLYYVEFAEWWMEHKSRSWLTSAGSYMSEKSRKEYLSFIELFKFFSGTSKIKLSNSGNAMITEFLSFLVKNLYSENTIKNYVKKSKFFFERAKEEGFKVDYSYTKRVYVPKSEKILHPFLNPKEIEIIYNLKINNEKLDNARDNLIIGCWTGLRVGDYLKRLDVSNIIDGFIKIETEKFATKVVIPIHPMVEAILKKRNGRFPAKTSLSIFGTQIKVVCKLAGINQKMKGTILKELGSIDLKKRNLQEDKLYKGSKNKIIRNVTDIYYKYELVTSHICRRSFLTNHIDNDDISKSTLKAIGGWKDHKTMLSYNKQSNTEYARKLEKSWKKNKSE
jgi:integrase